MYQVTKRDGKTVDFNITRIANAITKAFEATGIPYNPDIIKGTGEYRTQEACLSLEGVRPAARWRRIKVSYLDEEFHRHVRSFTGDVAQAIQHEVDHCNGVII